LCITLDERAQPGVHPLIGLADGDEDGHRQGFELLAHTGETMSTTQEIIEQRLRDLIADASARIDAEMTPACPTAGFLNALADEISAAKTDPSSVPYPELLDPDAYWEASVRPLGAAMSSSVDKILSWLEAGVISIMEVAESDMKSAVDNAIFAGGADPSSVRASLADEIEKRCVELHHLMAEILTVVPGAEAQGLAREDFENRLQAQAVADVDALKPAYMEAAGGDQAHQRYAEQQWSETHGERVAYRQALLRAEAPWRHQEIALVGYERSSAQVMRATETVVERLQAPLADMSALIMQRYDSIGSA